MGKDLSITQRFFNDFIGDNKCFTDYPFLWDLITSGNYKVITNTKLAAKMYSNSMVTYKNYIVVNK